MVIAAVGHFATIVAESRYGLRQRCSKSVLNLLPLHSLVRWAGTAEDMLRAMLGAFDVVVAAAAVVAVDADAGWFEVVRILDMWSKRMMAGAYDLHAYRGLKDNRIVSGSVELDDRVATISATLLSVFAGHMNPQTLGLHVLDRRSR